MSAKLKITLKRSAIGLERSQGATARLLGFTKLHQTRIHDDNKVIRGMIHKIRHLVLVEPIDVEPIDVEPIDVEPIEIESSKTEPIQEAN